MNDASRHLYVALCCLRLHSRGKLPLFTELPRREIPGNLAFSIGCSRKPVDRFSKNSGALRRHKKRIGATQPRSSRSAYTSNWNEVLLERSLTGTPSGRGDRLQPAV